MPSEPHLVVCVLGAWGMFCVRIFIYLSDNLVQGHIRPMLAFLSRIVKFSRSGVITLITAKAFMDRIHAEWGRHFEDDELALRNSLRFSNQKY